MSSFAQAGAVQAANDEDTLETQEWLEALAAVLDREGPQRAHYLLERLIDEARRSGAHIPFSPNTAYVNTIPPGLEPAHPGNLELEARIRSYVRWNAMAMVVKANKHNPPDGGDLGGHIASFASLATMIGCGQNHFWHAEDENHGGDLVYFQGHTSPGMYGRAYLEGRLTEDQLNHFRQEVDGKGLSSYPHPKLMPDFWQFPTVSMGLGPLMAIYQARFLKYLHARGIADTSKHKVWVFCGDGEMDEPESLGAIALAFAGRATAGAAVAGRTGVAVAAGPGAHAFGHVPGAERGGIAFRQAAVALGLALLERLLRLLGRRFAADGQAALEAAALATAATAAVLLRSGRLGEEGEGGRQPGVDLVEDLWRGPTTDDERTVVAGPMRTMPRGCGGRSSTSKTRSNETSAVMTSTRTVDSAVRGVYSRASSAVVHPDPAPRSSTRCPGRTSRRASMFRTVVGWEFVWS